MVRQRIDREKRMILCLAVLIAIVYGIAFGLSLLQRGQGEEDAEYMEGLRLPGTPSSIEVRNAAEPYSLARQGAEWACGDHPALRLSGTRITFMNLTFKELTPVRILPGGTEYLEKFGLDPPSAVITLTWPQGEKVYRIGGYNTVLNEYYMTVDDSECVYLIGAEDMKLINRPLLELVDEPQVTGRSGGEVERIQVKTAEEYEIGRKADGFEVKRGDTVFESSEYRVSGILSAFQAADYSCGYCDAPEEAFRRCGLKQAEAEVTFFFSDGAAFHLKVGTGEDGLHYLNENDDGVIYQIDDNYYEEILERTKLSNLGA